MGYHPRADWAGMQSTIPQVSTRLEQYNEARRKAQELMRRVQQSWVRHHDTPKYKVGDQVWLEGRHLRTNQPTAKLAPKHHGPFKVVQVMSPVNYRLGLPTQWSIHDVFYTDLLTPYCETPMHGANYQMQPLTATMVPRLITPTSNCSTSAATTASVRRSTKPSYRSATSR
jgi:hypothetical protein